MITTEQYESDDILSVKELKSTVRQSVKNIIDKERFTEYIANIKNQTTNGGNYLGTLQTVAITGKTEGGENKELRLFLKNIMHIEDQFAIVDTLEAYQREGFFYREVFNYFEKIEDKYNIPVEERLNTVKGYSETNDEVIILEDVSCKGYKTGDRFKVVSLKFAELSIKELAKFHAMSFIIRNENPKYFENNMKSLRSLFKINEQLKTHLRRTFDKAKETLDETAKLKLEKIVPKMIDTFHKYIVVEPEEAICITHTDYRPDNILVKEIDGEAVKVIPVDYQIACFGCPVNDFLYFIFLGTDQEFRKNHMQDLKDLYYCTFESFLGKFGIDANEMYTKKQFEDDFRENLEYGLISFMSVMPFIFTIPGDIPDLGNGIENIALNLDERYKDRLHGVIDDFIQWGYL
ncbi:uncharacterized protein LOC114363684 [Ostrinia furnacalis]|uniref:uncharacterized protein LOC114363684 n=1 Tax=Ostrinia furnacalis TaxID=93504 RepID=UPI00103A7DDD|nr:uncharacterized protein LOC114363684 [Ostrinia furnacalis]